MTNFKQNFVTIEEFLQLAIRFEADSAEFYRTMKGLVAEEDDTTQELLNLLIREETEHQKRLQKFEVGNEQTSLLQFPPSLSFSMPALPAESPSLDECIAIGLAREKKSVEVYSNAAAMTTGKFQQLLTGLATFERQHVEKLLSLQRFFQPE